MYKPFPGLFFDLIIQCYVLPQCAVFLDVNVFVGSLHPDSLVAQVLFALPAALLSLVRFAHLLVYLYLVLFSCCNLVYILYL